MIEVRLAQAADAERISALAAEVQTMHADGNARIFKPAGSDTFPPSVIRERMATAGHLFWVAVVDGAVGGYAYATIRHEPETPWQHAAMVCTLDQMGVTAPCRGRGAGTALVDAVREAAAEHGAPEVRLNVWTFNRGARAFYERCGFVTAHERMWLPTGLATPPGVPDALDDLCVLSAADLAALLRRKRVSAREVMQAHLSRIARTNPKVNAIVTLVADRAMAEAAQADEAIAHGRVTGPLHGLPVAHKDLVDTAGIRTTYGSPFYRHHVPAADAPLVRRLRAAGAITLGKTNTPEFGAGSQTFNPVFGATRNPYDPTRTCGGSSGGAAAALACGMVPIADGSDTGGSLRNPAAFCNVVGLRPSPGRVPNDAPSWSPLSVAGPMARTVTDVALLLSVMAGHDAAQPLSIDENPAMFARPLDRDFRGTRVAWWTGLGGIPFDPEVRRIVDSTRPVFERLGCVVEDAEPDFSGVDVAFLTLRHLTFHANYAALARERPEWVKDTIHWEIAEAEQQTAADVASASARQSRMFAQAAAFFERYEYFVLPVTQVAPFDLHVPYPRTIDGRPMETYIDWMRSCWYVSFMASPAISVPAGFTSTGLPVGLQIVGRARGEWSVLQLAYAFEQATRHGWRRPEWLTDR